MLQIFKNPRFDFMRLRTFGYVLSGAFVVLSLGLLGYRWKTRGDALNYGIDFRGGSLFEVRFADSPDEGRLRQQLAEHGFGGASLQRFGGDDEKSVLIQIGEHLEEATQLVQQIRLALRPEAERTAEEQGRVDLNTVDERDLAAILERAETGSEPTSVDPAYVTVARAVAERRDQQPEDMFGSLDEVRDVPGLTAKMYEGLGKEAFVGSLVFERVESVGPTVGQDLRRKAIFASIVANSLILVYLWFRFELRFGVAAVLCLVHDALFVLGCFALTDREFDLTVLAAILTIIGYSVNDTIVIFDRIRANLKVMRKDTLPTIINASVNQTLSRTVLTSGATLLVVVPLYLYGGATLNGFAFALMIGILVGSYSTIFVASPLLVVWQRLFGAAGKA